METDLNAVEMGSVGPSSTAAAAAVATTPVTSSFSTSSSSQPPLTHSSPGVISFSPMLSSTPVCRNARLPSSPASRRRRRSSASSAGAASTLLLAALGILCVRGFAVAAAEDSSNGSAEPLPDPVKKV
jgi:cell division septation protein DedD